MNKRTRTSRVRSALKITKIKLKKKNRKSKGGKKRKHDLKEKK